MKPYSTVQTNSFAALRIKQRAGIADIGPIEPQDDCYRHQWLPLPKEFRDCSNIYFLLSLNYIIYIPPNH